MARNKTANKSQFGCAFARRANLPVFANKIAAALACSTACFSTHNATQAQNGPNLPKSAETMIPSFHFGFPGIDSPALLQSTVKLFFCPTRALDSPVPRQTTLLASEVSFVAEVEEEELKAPPTFVVLVTVSTKTEEVSWRLCPPDSRAPVTQGEPAVILCHGCSGAALHNGPAAAARGEFSLYKKLVKKCLKFKGNVPYSVYQKMRGRPQAGPGPVSSRTKDNSHTFSEEHWLHNGDS